MLALEVAYRTRQRGTEVWWVSAVESDALAIGMRTVGRRVGLTDDELNHADACDLIWERLSTRTGLWLLILDNADDPRILTGPGTSVADGQGWLRPVESGAGQVLVTSRDGSAASWGSWCIRYRLAALTGDDAARVLIDRAGTCGSQWEARALAERLGGLPLALRIAGSYLAEAASVPAAFADPGLIRTFSQYRQALDAGDLKRVFPATQDEARRLIGRTWDLSLDLLDARGMPEARQLLRLLATFADAPIPYLLLLHTLTLAKSSLFEGITGTSLWRALRALESLGLIELDTDSPARIAVARLHPLVRDTSVPRSVYASDDHAAHVALAARLVESAADIEKTGRPEDPTAWPMWQLLSPHILHVFDALVNAADDDPAVAMASSAHLAARYQAALGLYSEAAIVQRRVLSVVERSLGSYHPNVLATRHEIARLKAARGYYRVAEDELLDVLIARRRVHGSDHPSTLTTRHELARMMAEREQYAQAESLFQDVLAARLRVQGPGHPYTLTAHHAIGWVMAIRGDYARAEEELRSVLAARLRVQGPDHPDTLATRHDLAQVMADLGNYAEAEAEFADLLDAQERVLGHYHPSTDETAVQLESLRFRRTGGPGQC